MKCVLNVTDQEYGKVLQLNHDSLVLNKRDESLLQGLEALLGPGVADELRRYDECRMQPHHSLAGLRRVERCVG
jgi:hypothetical protein